jgi:redox-sensitive bicupin YhaK (pirin superfamily)
MNKQTAATFEVRRAEDRGRSRFSWLDSRHSFSFGDYFDENNMGFGALRVLNDDRVAGGGGFGMHGHRDMEILSYVLDGAMQHKDNMGTGSVIHPGEIQMMRAGTGVMHSEFNQSKTEPLHFLQIWIVPDARGLKPAYAQQAVDQAAAKNSFALLASRDGRSGSIQIHQDVDLWLADIAPEQTRTLALRPGRRAWIQMARGSVVANGVELKEGDGAALTNEESIQFLGKKPAEVLIFDLA